MKKIILRLILFIALLVVLHQVYWYTALGGNLSIWVLNQSDFKSIDQVEFYIDGQKIAEDNFPKQMIENHFYTLKLSPGKHNLTVINKNNNINEEYEFYSFFVKRAYVFFSRDFENEKNIEAEMFIENIIGRKYVN